MDRGRERSYGDDRDARENNYRPRASDGPSRGGYRNYRSSPPPRERTPPSYRDTHPLRDERRRSRSPPYASRGDGGYRARPRSPPPRGYSPRRDTRPRSPPRPARRYSRSPVRARSPLPSRRDPSPYNRRPRSPPPSKRHISPRDRLDDRRAYSPPRQPRTRFPNENNYRPGEVTRSPPPRREEQRSRIPSPISSRRSSPPMHPDRLVQARSHSPGNRRPPAPSGPRNSSYRERSPPPPKSYPVEEPPATRQRTPPRDEGYMNGAGSSQHATAHRNGDSRPPPRGPSGYNSYKSESPARAPPSEPLSMSAHNRPSSNAVLSAPTQPRGGRGNSAFARPDSRDQPYGVSSNGRGTRPPPVAPFHARDTPPAREARPSPSTERIPNGPRSSYGRGNHSYEAPPAYAPPFRSNNSSSTTYPRTQRFNNPINHLASVPAIVPGGKLLPSMDPAADKKLAQLEEESKRLRDAIDEKQKGKRQMLRDWESRDRESRREGLRSELAEAQLEQLSGEQIGGAAF